MPADAVAGLTEVPVMIDDVHQYQREADGQTGQIARTFFRVGRPLKTTSTKINVNTASAMKAYNIIPSANPLEPVAVGPP